MSHPSFIADSYYMDVFSDSHFAIHFLLLWNNSGLLKGIEK